MTGWALAKRDLRGGLGGLGLLFACLLLAIAGLAAVLSLTASLERAIADNGRALLGGDLRFEQTQRPPTGAELATLAEAGEISRSISTRAMVRTAEDVALVELTGADSAFPLAGTLEIEGRRPTAPDEIALDRTLAIEQGVETGDTVRLGTVDFTVTGFLVRLPGGTFRFAPPALLTEEGIAASGLVVPGSLADYEIRVLLDDDSAMAEDEERLRAALEPIGWESDSRDGVAGGTQRFVGAAGDLLLFIAIAALGIGALGIGSAMRAFAAGRRVTVARLKLLGATSRPLSAMLTIETLLITVAALVPGLAVGALAPPIVSRLVGDRFPVLPDPGPHWDALFLAGAVGLLVTLAASWRPLAGALRTSPKAILREDGGKLTHQRIDIVVPLFASIGAIALLLAGSDEPRLAAIAVAALLLMALVFAGLGWIVQRLARSASHRGSPPVRLGIAALDRPGNATRRLVVSLGLGLSMLVGIAAGSQSVLTELETALPARAPSHFMLDIPKDGRETLVDVVNAASPDAELVTVPSMRGSVTKVDGVPVADLPDEQRSWLVRGDRGLTFARDVPDGNRVVAGEWWPADYDGPPRVSLEADAARQLELEIGDTISFSIAGREVTATVGALREVDWQSVGLNFGIIFAPGTLEDAPFTYLATVAPPEGGSMGESFLRDLNDALPGVTAIAVSDVLAEIRSILAALDAAVRIATLLAIAIGVVVLAGSVVATRAQRAREIALLRLVGARWRQLVASQLVEFVILSGAATLLAMAVGLGLAWAAIRFAFEMGFRPDVPSLVLLGVGTVVVSVVAALVAVRPALVSSPSRTIRAR